MFIVIARCIAGFPAKSLIPLGEGQNNPKNKREIAFPSLRVLGQGRNDSQELLSIRKVEFLTFGLECRII